MGRVEPFGSIMFGSVRSRLIDSFSKILTWLVVASFFQLKIAFFTT